jgi:hypothetical protein
VLQQEISAFQDMFEPDDPGRKQSEKKDDPNNVAGDWQAAEIRKCVADPVDKPD